jgi:hypothetical protein
MTFLGKLLVFLNLIFGIGTAVFATPIYTNRPSWHDDLKDEPISKGNRPVTFKQLETEIRSEGTAAALASVNWGTNEKALVAAEALHMARHERMFGKKPDGTKAAAKGLIDFAREGNPAGAAFLDLTEDSATRLLVLDSKSVVTGPDNQPLQGTETLLDQYVKDLAEAETQALLSKKLRAEQKTLGDQIVVVQEQIYKQRDIRDNLVVEASRLEAFEVNATEHMQTVTRRRNQLIGRLSPFRLLEKK